MQTCIESGFILIDGQERFHRVGQPYADDDPMVRAKPSAFRTLEPTSGPLTFHDTAGPVESATNAPGEKRTTVRPAPGKTEK